MRAPDGGIRHLNEQIVAETVGPANRVNLVGIDRSVRCSVGAPFA